MTRPYITRPSAVAPVERARHVRPSGCRGGPWAARRGPETCDYVYSRPENFVSFSKAWYASTRRTVPDRERITIESVIAPSLV